MSYCPCGHNEQVPPREVYMALNFLQGSFFAPFPLLLRPPIAPKELRGQLTPGPPLNIIVSPSQNLGSWISQPAILKIPSAGAHRLLRGSGALPGFPDRMHAHTPGWVPSSQLLVARGKWPVFMKMIG